MPKTARSRLGRKKDNRGSSGAKRVLEDPRATPQHIMRTGLDAARASIHMGKYSAEAMAADAAAIAVPKPRGGSNRLRAEIAELAGNLAAAREDARVSKQRAKAAEGKVDYHRAIAASRPSAREKRAGESEFKQVIVELQEQATPVTDFGKVERPTSHGTAHVWPLWMVQLVVEQLINGLSPGHIAASIASHEGCHPSGASIIGLPSEDWCCNMRTL